MSKPAVEVRNLAFTYPDGTEALRGITLRVEPGEAVGIIGENGAGKSTLLLHLSGCLLPSGGGVHVGEVPLTTDTLREIRRRVGTVFQDPDDQLFMPTVGEDVAFGPASMGLSPEMIESHVVEALTAAGALPLRYRSPSQLSGGEKRSASLATVLAMSPEVLLLDEPSSGLDPRSRRQLIRLLLTLPHTRILATHDLDMVMEVCSRVLLLHRGQLVADAPPSVLFSPLHRDLLEECALEMPLRLQGCPFCAGSSPEDDPENPYVNLRK